MLGQTIKDIIEELNNDFSAQHIEKVVLSSGSYDVYPHHQCVNLKQYIFLHGESDEVYSKLERHFIDSVKDAYIFSDFYKETSRGKMACRFIAVDLSGNYDEIFQSVLFMKIINKAIDGFNIFIIKLTDGIHVGIKTFDRDESRNCTLSEVDSEGLYIEELEWASSYKKFFDYYNSIFAAINSLEKTGVDYDKAASWRRGMQYDYIEVLQSVGLLYGVSVQKEIDRYCAFFEEPLIVETFGEIVHSYVSELSHIKSSRINTLEMLFEAEEIEKITNQTESKRESEMETMEDNNDDADEEIMNQYRNDPEAMIKMLKGKRGIM